MATMLYVMVLCSAMHLSGGDRCAMVQDNKEQKQPPQAQRYKSYEAPFPFKPVYGPQ